MSQNQWGPTRSRRRGELYMLGVSAECILIVHSENPPGPISGDESELSHHSW